MIQQGVAASGLWRTVSLVKAAWEKGASPEFIRKGFSSCGLAPWNPDKVLKDQSLFQTMEDIDFELEDAANAEILPAARRPLPGPGGEGAEGHKMAPFCDTAFLNGIRAIYHVDKLQL